ncbi:MAG: histidine kinase [Cytophagaceae bacterium]|nr:histidine kinase [Cytophagaceae bacterium]MDW8455275.1 histidine kinase [Cytophagaceae bacterium]
MSEENIRERKHLNKNISNRLIILYSIALGLVALCTITGQLLIQSSITDLQSDSRVINIAGRQRMLSQKICKTILLITDSSYTKERKDYLVELKNALTLWDSCFNGLRNGVIVHEKKLPVKNSPVLDSMHKAITPYMKIMYHEATNILNHYSGINLLTHDEIKQAKQIILKNEKKFLELQNKIVFQYDLEANQRVKYLKQTELILFIITMLVLFLEGIFIFRPATQKINETIEMLIKSEADVIRKNDELMQLNRSLQETEQKLLTATEEKINNQIMHGKIRSASLIEGQEEERKRIAIELHDGLGQMLTALKLKAENIGQLPFENEKDTQNFNELKQLITETIAEVRTISFNLMPSVLTDFGIRSALEMLIEQLSKTSRTTIIFDSNLQQKRFDSALEIALYRICQEALNNALKHAHAENIIVQLNQKNDHLLLIITDDGVGFDAHKILSAKRTDLHKNGIYNMQARTELLNGEIKISSSQANGTKIYVRIPLTNHALKTSANTDYS